MSGPHIENLERWREIGASTTEENGEVNSNLIARKKYFYKNVFSTLLCSKVVTKSDIIFLCVKPHMLITVASQVKSSVVASTREKDKVFVSVLAGVTLAQLAIVRIVFLFFIGKFIKKKQKFCF